MPFLAALGDLLKKQPKIPTFTPVVPGEEQIKAIRSNTNAIADLKKLAEEANNLTVDEFKRRLSMLVPDSGQILSNVSSNIADMTAGNIPEDVASAVERRSAARSYAGGYGGSQRAGFLRTRDLGLTSLDLTQKGLDNATRWLTTLNNAAPQFDQTSMFITPQQQLQNTWLNTRAQMNNDWMKAQQEAEKNPGTIFGNALNQADEFIQQAVIAYLGGAGGGMMGGGGAGSIGAASSFNTPKAGVNTGNAIGLPPGYNYGGYGYGG